MFNLIDSTLFFASYGNIFGLANIAVSPIDIILAYVVAIVISIIMAFVLKVPLLPSKPYRYSFDVCAVYPTPIIAIGILSALFVKYLFNFVFPKPLNEDEGDEINE